MAGKISFDFPSFIRGYHIFKDIWDPQMNEVLQCKHEKGNSADKFAIGIVRNGTVVGHAPRDTKGLATLLK